MKKQEFPNRRIQHNDADFVAVYELPEIYGEEALEKLSASEELREELTELHENHYPNHRLILGMKGDSVVIIGMMEKKKDAALFMWHHLGLIGSENILPLKPLRQERMTVEDVEELAEIVEHPGFICFKEGEKKPFIIKSKAFKK